MVIHEAEESLFAEWRLKRPTLVTDGVVHEASYVASEPRRLLFVLKEVNYPGGGPWDLLQFLRGDAMSSTWNNIARWVAGIRRLPEDVPWAEVEHIAPRRREFLRGIAATNLKKTAGSGACNAAELERIAAEDSPFLSRQFALYDADIVVCCGTDTTAVFRRHVSIGDAADCDADWQETSRGIWFRRYGRGKVVLSFSHPQAHVWNHLLYYGLIDALREVLFKVPDRPAERKGGNPENRPDEATTAQ